VVLLCDASKFGHRSLARVCDLSEANVLVTDATPPDHLAEPLKAAGVRIIVAA
jgi:DeoR family glycerol-3-phosphate regulon repressor